MENPLISIIIPAKNAQPAIKKCLDALLSLDYPAYEVIVINDGSGDETGELLAGCRNIKVLTTSGIGPAAARNLALKEAKGDFIAFTDADCLVDKKWLQELLRGFMDQKVAGAGGIQKAAADETRFGRNVQRFLEAFGFISGYMQTSRQMRRTKHNPSCNVMYRKSVLLETGGFLEGLWPGEDVELDYRIRKKGYRLIFNPAAAVYHYRVKNLRDFSRMMFNYGCWSAGYLLKRYGIIRVVDAIPILLAVSLTLVLYNCAFGLLFLATLLFLVRFRLAVLGIFFTALFFWNLGFFRGLTKKE